MNAPILLHAALETARICVPTLIDARRGSLRHIDCDERLRSWATRLLNEARAHVSVEGLDEIKGTSRTYVVVSNHQSHYDIPVLYSTLPLSLRMAAKKELFRTPIWGPALRASGFVEMDRTNSRAAYDALQKAGHFMREHSISLFVAPEGTRSPDGRLGHFKKGAFHLAKAAEVPVLPIAIDGTFRIHAKGSRAVQRGCHVTVRLLPPLFPEDFGSVKAMAEVAKDSIARVLQPTA